MPSCPLCNISTVDSLLVPDFFQCTDCNLLFKNPEHRLSAADEKDRYSLHENYSDDIRYVNFLWPVIDELKKIKGPGCQGLDYGSGPNPVLVELLNKEGYPTKAYDPFYRPRDLQEFKNLDFVVSTEAAEHFYDPLREFEQIFSMLKPDGVFIVMTELYREDIDLTKWHYVRDPTHVVFYSPQTMEYLAKKFKKELNIVSHRLVVFR